MLKVEQADRVLASQIVISTENAKRILAGENDDHPWVRKVAQYREDTALPLREALVEIATLVRDAFNGTVASPQALDAITDVVVKALSPDTTGGE